MFRVVLTMREGSPPHGRGKARCAQPRDARNRITPAWAGKSLLTIPKLTTRRDHPRMGGEKTSSSFRRRAVSGSPPHGRGKGLGFPALFDLLGITPAWAGKSSISRRAKSSKGDHPRMGGEKRAGRAAAAVGEGSPPHGRGKGYDVITRLCGVRITPAWAGKSARSA